MPTRANDISKINQKICLLFNPHFYFRTGEYNQYILFEIINSITQEEILASLQSICILPQPTKQNNLKQLLLGGSIIGKKTTPPHHHTTTPPHRVPLHFKQLRSNIGS